MTAKRFLHVANGTSTTMTIAAAGISGTLSIWADPMYDGPVPGGLSDDELIDVRAGFLAWPDNNPADVVDELKRWRGVISSDTAYDELVLWFEHDLFDQLNLIQLLDWIRDHSPGNRIVSLICIGSFPGRPDFKGLGELTPSELAPLLETRQPVTPAQYALASDAWQAFRAPTPEALVRLLQSDTSALPFLAPAIRRWFEEYPWTTDGLARYERRLLQLAANGSIELSAIFPRMQDGERSYYITDGSLAELAETLSTTTPPLATLVAGESDGPSLLHKTFTLTDDGRDVLNGRVDRVKRYGIDRWLGGVHLQSGEVMWRWDPTREQLVTTQA